MTSTQAFITQQRKYFSHIILSSMTYLLLYEYLHEVVMRLLSKKIVKFKSKLKLLL
jgi:hypothetical protein